MNTEASGFDPTAVERVFAAELTAKERADPNAERKRTQAKRGIRYRFVVY